ncbi:hypothetical protein ACFT8W_03135 [Streptomyces hygroscopicus]|uniref:hypothetical protein n=1 Tax=Streptomyces hygroscopicus TaxID=1912 RepID=UPI0036307C60
MTTDERTDEETVRGQVRKEQIDTEGVATTGATGNRKSASACTRRPARNLLGRAGACVPGNPNCRDTRGQAARAAAATHQGRTRAGNPCAAAQPLVA